MSEENKLTTNQIEKVLLEKKQKEFRQEVGTAIKNLDQVLYKYFGTFSTEEFKTYASWLTQKALVPQYHYHGGNVISSNLHSDYYPKFLNEVLLKRAVDEFLKSVEDTKTQLDEVYNNINM
jgi:hypothetical protein